MQTLQLLIVYCVFYVMKSLRYTSGSIVHSKVMSSRCYEILRKLVFIFKYCLLVQHVHLLYYIYTIIGKKLKNTNIKSFKRDS